MSNASPRFRTCHSPNKQMMQILQEILDLSKILSPFSPPGHFEAELTRMPFAKACSSYYYTSQLRGPARGQTRQENLESRRRRRGYRNFRGDTLHHRQQLQCMDTLYGTVDHPSISGDGLVIEDELQQCDTDGNGDVDDTSVTSTRRTTITGCIPQQLSAEECGRQGHRSRAGFCRGGSSGSWGNDGSGGDGDTRETLHFLSTAEHRERRRRGRAAGSSAAATNNSGDVERDAGRPWPDPIPTLRRRARSLSAFWRASAEQSSVGGLGMSLSNGISHVELQERNNDFAADGNGRRRSRDWEGPGGRLAWTTEYLNEGDSSNSALGQHLLGWLEISKYLKAHELRFLPHTPLWSNIHDLLNERIARRMRARNYPT